MPIVALTPPVAPDADAEPHADEGQGADTPVVGQGAETSIVGHAPGVDDGHAPGVDDGQGSGDIETDGEPEFEGSKEIEGSKELEGTEAPFLDTTDPPRSPIPEPIATTLEPTSLRHFIINVVGKQRSIVCDNKSYLNHFRLWRLLDYCQ